MSYSLDLGFDTLSKFVNGLLTLPLKSPAHTEENAQVPGLPWLLSAQATKIPVEQQLALPV
jgi:hypothetical protein